MTRISHPWPLRSGEGLPSEAALQNLYASPPARWPAGGVGLLEKLTYGLSQSRRCWVKVQVCLRCDRGNVCCAGECSRLPHHQLRFSFSNKPRARLPPFLAITGWPFSHAYIRLRSQL